MEKKLDLSRWTEVTTMMIGKSREWERLIFCTAGIKS